MPDSGWWRQFWLAMTGRWPAEPAAPAGHRMVPCPVRPFRDGADQAAALGAALVFVTREITGEWPRADAVKAAVDALLTQTVP